MVEYRGYGYMRVDGKRVKNVDNMYTIVPYFMVDRSDACNAITVRVPYKPIHDYVIKRRNSGTEMSYLGVVIAAFVRTVSEHPFLNRFVVNKKIYAHNELLISMVVLRSGENAQTSMGKMKFELQDTVFDVNNKICNYVSDNRNENSNDTDKILSILVKMPWLINIATRILKLMDKYGLLPKAVIKMSPFHATAVCSNLASIRTNHIYHHIYNFGTIGTIFTIGNLEDVPKMKDGEVILERQMPFGIMCDERIGDGHDYAKAFATLSKYLKNPELLEVPPQNVLTDF